MRTITYDGVDLSTYGTVEDVMRPAMASVSVSRAAVPGMDGARYLGSTIEPLSITVQLRVIGTGKADMRSKIRALAALLRVDGPKALTISDEPSLHWMAVPSGGLDVDEWTRTALVSVTFWCPSPAAYGVTQSVTMTGSTLVIDVVGTYPTRPTITATASGSWRLVDETGAYVALELGSTAKAIVIDCDARTVTVGGSTSVITLESTWLEFEPGAHTLTLTSGNGMPTLTWAERWV